MLVSLLHDTGWRMTLTPGVWGTGGRLCWTRAWCFCRLALLGGCTTSSYPEENISRSAPEVRRGPKSILWELEQLEQLELFLQSIQDLFMRCLYLFEAFLDHLAISQTVCELRLAELSLRMSTDNLPSLRVSLGPSRCRSSIPRAFQGEHLGLLGIRRTHPRILARRCQRNVMYCDVLCVVND